MNSPTLPSAPPGEASAMVDELIAKVQTDTVSAMVGLLIIFMMVYHGNHDGNDAAMNTINMLTGEYE